MAALSHSDAPNRILYHPRRNPDEVALGPGGRKIRVDRLGGQTKAQELLAQIYERYGFAEPPVDAQIVSVVSRHDRRGSAAGPWIASLHEPGCP